MDKVLLAFLERLEAIEERFDGLGDTIVRDFMAEDVRRGFLRAEPGFVPSGEYDLDPAANRLVRDGIAEFCAAAKNAAQQAGLQTFRQRLNAFQNPAVRTPNGSDYNDFFGFTDPESLDEYGNEFPRKRNATVAATKQQGLQFNRAGTLAELLAALNRTGPWQWHEVDPDYEPYLEAQCDSGLRLRVREEYALLEADGTERAPDYQYLAHLEFKAHATGDAERLMSALRGNLQKLHATDITAVVDYYW